MLVEERRLETLFRKMKNVREEVRAYVLAGDNLRVSVDDLHHTIERMYGFKVTLHEVSFIAKHLESSLLRYSDGRAHVLLRAGLSEPRQRFAVTKELCHLVLDEPEDWSLDVKGTIRGLIEVMRLEISGEGEHAPDNEAVVGEYLAVFAATELLYPLEWREQDVCDLAQNKTTVVKLGMKYSLPLRAVKIALDPAYNTICRQFGTKIL